MKIYLLLLFSLFPGNVLGISGGIQLENGEDDYLIRMEYLESGITYCSGALLTPRKFVTACHCVPRNANSVKVRSNLWALDDPGKKSKSFILGREDFVEHPNCRQLRDGRYFHDIAIGTLPETIEFHHHLKLPSLSGINFESYIVSGNFYAVGWGQKFNAASMKNELTNQPQAGFYPIFQVIDQYLRPLRSTACICMGDSGGPLVLKDTRGYFIMGIAIASGPRPGLPHIDGSIIPCVYQNFEQLFLRLDIHEPFILENLGETDPCDYFGTYTDLIFLVLGLLVGFVLVMASWIVRFPAFLL